MPIELSAAEARVIGCLMEKSVTTPDQYPLTLNALTNACNQKSSRDPIMSMEPGAVQGTIRSLEGKHLVRTEENFRTQVEKYSQRLCNTPFSDYQFEPAQYAVMTVLLLRGSRTPGELKANSGRLHAFADNAEVVETLESLIDREEGAVVVELPRTPGRRDPEYMHLLSGAVESATVRQSQRSTLRSVEAPAASQQADTSELERRISSLEAEVSSLRTELDDLRQHRSSSSGPSTTG